VPGASSTPNGTHQIMEIGTGFAFRHGLWVTGVGEVRRGMASSNGTVVASASWERGRVTHCD
jgi:hypothetical protein